MIFGNIYNPDKQFFIDKQFLGGYIPLFKISVNLLSGNAYTYIGEEKSKKNNRGISSFYPILANDYKTKVFLSLIKIVM